MQFERFFEKNTGSKVEEKLMDSAIKKEVWDVVAAEPRPFNSSTFGSNVRKGFMNVWRSRAWADIVLVVGKEKVRETPTSR